MLYVKSKKEIISYVAVAYFLLRFLYSFKSVSMIYVVLYSIVETLPIFLVDNALPKFKRSNIFFALVFLFSITISALFANNVISYVAFSILNLYLANWMAKDGIDRKCTWMLFIIISLVIFIRIAVTSSVDLVFNNTSRNSISSFSILTSVLIYSTYDKEDYLSILPAIVTMLLSLVGLGRGGVISSSILLIGIIIINMKNKKNLKLRILFIALIALAIFVYLLYKYYDYFLSATIMRFGSQKITDNERVDIIAQYLFLTMGNFKNLMFGLSPKAIPAVQYLNGNFHNSFLALHSSFGLVGFLIVVLSLIKSFLMNIKYKNFRLLLLLTVVCVRISTDYLSFVGYYDVLIYYLILLSGSSKQKCDMKREKGYVYNIAN
jgi:hypothetical protein